MTTLTRHASQSLATHMLAYDVATRRGKVLLALQALVRVRVMTGGVVYGGGMRVCVWGGARRRKALLALQALLSACVCVWMCGISIGDTEGQGLAGAASLGAWWGMTGVVGDGVWGCLA